MTAAASLLAELRARGVTLEARGDKLRYRPASAVSPDVVERMRGCKAELLALLARESEPPADELERSWTLAHERARLRFAAAGREPSDSLLVAAAALELARLDEHAPPGFALAEIPSLLDSVYQGAVEVALQADGGLAVRRSAEGQDR